MNGSSDMSIIPEEQMVFAFCAWRLFWELYGQPLLCVKYSSEDKKAICLLAAFIIHSLLSLTTSQEWLD